MVSGVGPASVLQSLEIPVVADLPGVGQDLWVSYPSNRRSFGACPRLRPFKILLLVKLTQSLGSARVRSSDARQDPGRKPALQ